MATSNTSSNQFGSMMLYKTNLHSITTQSRRMESKISKNHEHFRFGGNRKDPLNLNELIQKSNQLAQSSINYKGNDRPVEIFLQPDIYDPLCLDISSYNNEDFIPSNSTNQQTYTRKQRRNFQDYNAYRQRKHDNQPKRHM